MSLPLTNDTTSNAKDMLLSPAKKLWTLYTDLIASDCFSNYLFIIYVMELINTECGSRWDFMYTFKQI